MVGAPADRGSRRRVLALLVIAFESAAPTRSRCPRAFPHRATILVRARSAPRARRRARGRWCPPIGARSILSALRASLRELPRGAGPCDVEADPSARARAGGRAPRLFRNCRRPADQSIALQDRSRRLRIRSSTRRALLAPFFTASISRKTLGRRSRSARVEKRHFSVHLGDSSDPPPIHSSAPCRRCGSFCCTAASMRAFRPSIVPADAVVAPLIGRSPSSPRRAPRR